MDSSTLGYFCTSRDYRSEPKAASSRETKGELYKVWNACCCRCFCTMFCLKALDSEPGVPMLLMPSAITEGMQQ